MKKIFTDESAQVSAELIAIFGGIIVIVMIALFSYNNYLKGLGSSINSSNNSSQLHSTSTSISNLKNLFT